MNITVILCTFNRSESLSQALESVAASQLPDSVEWEVLVVDNNSLDNTRAVTEDIRRQHPGRFRYLFEPRQGKSYALNSGIREASGEILAFMDDDVSVDSKWLQRLTGALDSGEWVGAGGRILPEQPFSPPRWLAIGGPQGMGGVLALFDRGDEPGELDWAPFGTNMAFRRSMFEKYGGFRTDLGPNRGSEIRGEDTEFGRRLTSAGERLRYEPQAIVYHSVPPNRLHKGYFLTWWFDFGRALVLEQGRGPNLWGIPRPYFSILRAGTIELAGRTLRWMLAFQPSKRFFYKALVWRIAGEIAQLYRLARSPIRESEK
jgi:glycosyltransferase involved in cell wall biosynthesis